jgi:hypothetical protein
MGTHKEELAIEEEIAFVRGLDAYINGQREFHLEMEDRIRHAENNTTR